MVVACVTASAAAAPAAVSAALHSGSARAPACPPCRLGRCAAAATDVTQAAVGAALHRRVVPSAADISPWAALAYLPYGSAALWLVLQAAFSFLPISLDLLKLALSCYVLVAGSDGMCASSPGLQVGYATLHAWLAALLRLAQAAACRAASAAASLAAASLVPPQDCAADTAAAASAASGTAIAELASAQQPREQPHEAAQAQLRLCLLWQTTVLLLAFVGSTWAAHRSRVRMRLYFLRRQRWKAPRAARQGLQEPQAAMLPGVQREMRLLQRGTTADFLMSSVFPAVLCILLAAHM